MPRMNKPPASGTRIFRRRRLSAPRCVPMLARIIDDQLQNSHIDRSLVRTLGLNGFADHRSSMNGREASNA